MTDSLSGLIAAMEILPDGLLVVDNRRVIIACNRVVQALFGYRDGELEGQPLSILLPPALRAKHEQNIDHYERVGGDLPMSKRAVLFGISKSGKKVPVSVGISALGDKATRMFIAVVRDARSVDDTLEDVVILAETDPLTQLGNRRYLSSRLEAMEAEGRDSPVALLLLDLDQFKPLNDEFGHETGDKVLCIVARRLRGCLRERDVCVRLGGDEFVVLLGGIQDQIELERIALKLAASVTAPINVGGLNVSVGVSIGGAIGSPSHSGANALQKQADSAMYRAKSAGSTYAFFDASAAPDP